MSKIVLAPVFNDPKNALKLVEQIASQYKNVFESIILVDDGSLSSLYEDFRISFSARNQKVTILQLSSNFGHQRAIAIGLCYLSEQYPSADIIIMDSDGEDGVHQIQSLLDSFDEKFNIVARRSKRQESFWFRQGYWSFKIMFKLFTGQNLNFGNYTMISSRTVKALVQNITLWNNYPATLLRNKIELKRIDLPRQKRYSGKSSLNLISFIQHGLGAISVFLDIVLIRVLIVLSSVLVLALSTLIVLLALLSSSFSNMIVLYFAFMFIIAFIILNISISVLFSIIIYLGNRSMKQDPPIMFYKHFIFSSHTLEHN